MKIMGHFAEREASDGTWQVVFCQTVGVEREVPLVIDIGPEDTGDHHPGDWAACWASQLDPQLEGPEVEDVDEWVKQVNENLLDSQEEEGAG